MSEQQTQPQQTPLLKRGLVKQVLCGDAIVLQVFSHNFSFFVYGHAWHHVLLKHIVVQRYLY